MEAPTTRSKGQSGFSPDEPNRSVASKWLAINRSQLWHHVRVGTLRTCLSGFLTQCIELYHGPSLLTKETLKYTELIAVYKTRRCWARIASSLTRTQSCIRNSVEQGRDGRYNWGGSPQHKKMEASEADSTQSMQFNPRGATGGSESSKPKELEGDEAR